MRNESLFNALPLLAGHSEMDTHSVESRKVTVLCVISSSGFFDSDVLA